MDTVHWAALQAIHGAVHASRALGLKYTWVGPGYVSNMYFKMMSDKPTFNLNTGGDYSFLPGDGLIHSFTAGDKDGKPFPQTGW